MTTRLDETVEGKIQELFAPLTTGFSPDMIDDRARDFLNELSVQNALAALEEFHEAIMEEGQRIRNKPAYFMGLLRRYRSNGDGRISHVRGRVGVQELDPLVRARLESLYASGFCRPADIDDRVVELMAQLSPQECIDAIGEYCGIPTERIKNHSAYLTGVLKRYLFEPNRGKGEFGGKGGNYGNGAQLGAPMREITAAVNVALQRLYDSGFCRPQDVDDRALDFLKELSEEDALAALQEFGQSDPSRINKISPFLMGVLKKYRWGKGGKMGGKGGGWGRERDDWRGSIGSCSATGCGAGGMRDRRPPPRGMKRTQPGPSGPLGPNAIKFRVTELPYQRERGWLGNKSAAGNIMPNMMSIGGGAPGGEGSGVGALVADGMGNFLSMGEQFPEFRAPGRHGQQLQQQEDRRTGEVYY